MYETLMPSWGWRGHDFRGHKERTNSTGIVLCSWILAPFQENFLDLKSSPHLAGADVGVSELPMTHGKQVELRLSLVKETSEADGGDRDESVWAVSEADCFSVSSAPASYFTRIFAPIWPWSIRASSMGTGRFSTVLAMFSLKKPEQQN